MRHDFSKINRKKAALTCGVCFLLLGLAYFWLGSAKSADQTAKSAVKPTVDTYAVKRQDMMRRVSLFGQTVSEAHIDIAPKYAGRIAAVNVKLGDQVREGDVLIVQDTGDLELSIAQNRAAVRQAEADAMEAESVYAANFQKAKADYERTRENDARYQELYAQGAISRLELDTIHQEMINSKAALDTLLNQTMAGEIPASVESKRAAYVKMERGTDALAKQRDDLILRAPRSGVIGYRAAEVGAIAQAGQKVLELVDNSRVYVDCQLSEQDVAAIRTGMPVEVDIESLGKRCAGEIIYISPGASDSKSYSVRIELDGEVDSIKAGMFARTQVEFVQRSRALFVPKEGVVEKNGRTYVFIIDGENRAAERAVTLGLRNDAEVEILSGLEEGEIVAVSNLARLKNGTVVEPGEAL